MSKYLMGIDGGTDGIRVGFYDIHGHQMGFESSGYITNYPRPGWAEQNPVDWWNGLGMACNTLLQRFLLQPKDIIAIGLDATSCTVVSSDDEGNPLLPALLWMDTRAANEADVFTRLGHRYHQGAPASAEWMGPKALWLKNHYPDLWSRTRLTEYVDWLSYHLTGRWTTSQNNATCRWYYDVTSGGWPLDFFSEAGLSDVIRKFPELVLPLGAVVGPLTSVAANHLGLVEGIPVAQGGVDAFVASVGLNALSEGNLGFITGSSHLYITESRRPIHGSGIFGSFPQAVVPETEMIEGGQVSTGSVLKWFVTNYMSGDTNSLSTWDGLANDLSPGSDGLIVLPHWQGSRTPFTDARARGMIYGLTLHHKPVHVYRAIMEGVAYGTRTILDLFAERGVCINKIIAGGGLLNSSIWLQIHADVAGKPIALPEVSQAAALGSAIVAATAVGLYPSIADAANHMVRYRDTVLPDPSRIQSYASYYRVYQKLDSAVRAVGCQIE